MPNKFGWLIMSAAFALALEGASAQQAYQAPPAPIGDILASPPPPAASLSPTRDRLALVTTERYPSVAQLAEPTLRLAGVKINPRTNGRARETKITGVTFLALADRKEVPLVIPGLPLAGLHGLAWCPDGRHFSILNSTPAGTQLYLGDSATGQAALVPGIAVSGVFGAADWANADSIFVWAVPAGRGAEPAAPLMPAGPVVQEAKGRAAPVRTYQDLLTNRHDEDLFRHYATAQLLLLNRTTLAATPLGTPGIVTAADRSPDGKFALVTRLDEPFSYLYPWSSFPKSVEVFDAATGAKVATVAKLPLQDTVPIEGVPTGPRSIRWLSAEPASLGYAQALDGGDPKAKVPFRDELFRLKAPFAQPAESLLKVEHRFGGMSFTDTGLAMISDYDRERRWTRTVQLDLAKPDAKTVVFDRSVQDRYGDPGAPLGRQLPNGQTAIRTAGGKLWLSAGGATPKGERPFLALYDPATRESTKVFECRAGFYETATPISDDGRTLLIRRESPALPPNFYLRTPDGAELALTQNADPFPQLRQVKKQLVSTKRPDGVTISFTLYTPPGYVEGTPLPTVFWAYPQEFNSADNAGQVSGSPDRFVTLAGVLAPVLPHARLRGDGRRERADRRPPGDRQRHVRQPTRGERQRPRSTKRSRWAWWTAAASASEATATARS